MKKSIVQTDIVHMYICNTNIKSENKQSYVKKQEDIHTGEKINYFIQL